MRCAFIYRTDVAPHLSSFSFWADFCSFSASSLPSRRTLAARGCLSIPSTTVCGQGSASMTTSAPSAAHGPTVSAAASHNGQRTRPSTGGVASNSRKLSSSSVPTIGPARPGTAPAHSLSLTKTKSLSQLHAQHNPGPPREGTSDTPELSPDDEVKRRYVRLLKLTVHELPRHPDLRTLQTGRENPTAEELVGEILDEAIQFLNDYNTKSEQQGFKASRPFRGKVASTRRLMSPELLGRTIPSSVRAPEDTRKRDLEDLELETEAWFGRSSVHPNRRMPAEPSANWVDFQYALFHDRNRREREYTPDVKDAHMICEWDEYLAGFGRDAKLSRMDYPSPPHAVR